MDLRRRKLALTSGALGALVALLTAACTPSADTAPSPSAEQTDSADAIETRWPIKHVVFIIKENRSFDNLFGSFPGANGVTKGRKWLGDDWRASPYWHGTPYAERTITVPLKTKYQWRYPQDLPHDYKQYVMDYRNGNMDGFANNPKADALAYTMVKPEWIPNYWYWAQQNVLSDNFFASAVGPSFPNHLMTIAATSAGTRDNPKQPSKSLNEMQEQGLAKSWGCDMKDGMVKIYGPEGKAEDKVAPCFDLPSEGELLDKKGIDWTYYAADNEQIGYIWSAYSAIDRYRNDQQLWDAHIKPVDDVAADIRENGLDPVTWVTPRFAQSEHPEWNLCYGENWTTGIVNAIMESPDWESTAIFITWDDWGGFYDHVKPKAVDPFGYGFRVPLITISPYAKQGYIDSREGEFSSVLRFVEDNWGLRQLTERDERADNLAYNFDFSQDARPADPQPLRECQGDEWAFPETWKPGNDWWPPQYDAKAAAKAEARAEAQDQASE